MRKRSLETALCCVALLTPLLYFMSTGPVLALYHRGYLGTNSGWYVSTLYAPIEHLCLRSDAFANLTRLYVTPWLPELLPGTPTFGIY